MLQLLLNPTSQITLSTLPSDAQSGKEIQSGEEADRWVDEYEATISADEYQWLDEYTAGEVLKML
jgi:hypothetical protein